MICSPSNRQRECYHTSDGQRYTKAGYLTFNHYYGELVRYSDTIFMIGGQSWKYETPGTIFFEDFNVNLNDPQVGFQNEVPFISPSANQNREYYLNPFQWTVKQTIDLDYTLLSGLVGLGGFSAINVPYKNAASNETIMIVGGYNERLGTSLIFVLL